MDKNFTTELKEITEKIGISVREELMKNLAQVSNYEYFLQS